MSKGRDPERTWRYLVRARLQGDRFPHEMKRLDHCELLGTATVDNGQPLRMRLPWCVIFSRVCPATVSMWNRRGYDVAPMRLLSPIGDPENGPACWHARLGDAWYVVEFSTTNRVGG